MAARGNSMYHLAALPVRVRGNSQIRTLSSTMELDMDHRWKVVMCAAGSSPCFPSNFGISEGILCGIGGQSGLWLMGSFVSLWMSGMSKAAKKGNFGFSPESNQGRMG